MDEHLLVFNGIDARSGTYLLPPFSVSQIARMALGQRLAPDELDELATKVAQDLDFPLREGKDPDDLADSGWAVVFPFARKGSEAARRQAAIRAALEPLLARRRAQATRVSERYYRECIGADAYRPGESKQQFLARMGAGSGAVDPDRFPYYLLLVASPEEIPYQVQYQLDVQYAVGRLHFDTTEEYALYAESVIQAEADAEAGAEPGAKPRTAAFFGVANPDDRATLASAQHLVEPLARFVERDQAQRGWQVRRFVAEHATKARLGALLTDEVPALLFTASHGIGFSSNDPLQREHQGALLCQDWQGPRAGAVSPDHYFAGEDITAGADLRGLIGFHFACFGAGTPKHDEFVRRALDQVEPVGLAPQPFLARLPQRMLGRPRGALACVGHVDRAWSSSFLEADPRHGSAPQLAVFESMLKRVMEGHRIGHAMDFFDLRYAELASDLTSRIEGIQLYDEACDEADLARMWIHASDARNYTVIGDPAVRLAHRAAPAPPRVAAPVAAVSGNDIDYRWFGRDGAGERPGVLGQLAGDVAQALRKLVADVTSLEVQTFAGDHDGARATVTGQPGSEPPRAYTHCAIDGDMVLCVPIRADGTIDEALWRIHENAVARAQQHRRDMLQLVLSLLPRALL